MTAEFYDVVIVGGGVSGLSAALPFARMHATQIGTDWDGLPHFAIEGPNKSLDVIILESGSRVGGGGGNNDHKENFPVGEGSVTGYHHLLADEGGVWSRSSVLETGYHIASFKQALMYGLGVPGWNDLGNIPWKGTDSAAYDKWVAKLNERGLGLERLVQYHLGTTNGAKVMSRWGEFLQKNGIEIRTKTPMARIEKIGDNPHKARFRVHTNNNSVIEARYVVLARGRHKEMGGTLAPETVWNDLGAKWVFGAADFGLRVEYHNKAFLPMIRDGLYDVKIRPFRHMLPSGDKIRLFCGSPQGGKLFLELIKYLGRNRLIVNGVADPSMYGVNPANFSVLQTIRLKEPHVDPIRWALQQVWNMNYLASEMGWDQEVKGRKPKALVQRFAHFLGPRFYDLNPWIASFDPEIGYENIPNLLFPGPLEWNYRRSRVSDFNQEGWFRSTIEKNGKLLATPGDFNRALDGRFRDNLRNFLFMLAREFPLIVHPGNLLAGPEYKAYGKRMVIDGFCESTVPGVYGVGDGEIETHGINPAEVSGVTAAAGILRAEGMTMRIGVDFGPSAGSTFKIDEAYLGDRVYEVI